MKVVWIVVGAVVVVLVLPGILLGLANVVNTGFGIGERSVSGTVSHEGGELALPEGAVVDVVLLELPPESPPLRIVIVRKELDGEIALPLEFKLTYHEGNIHEEVTTWSRCLCGRARGCCTAPPSPLMGWRSR